MKKNLISGIALVLCSWSLGAQSPVGFWKTYDDATGKNKGVVEIFEKDGAIFGKLSESFISEPGQKCEVCPDDRKDQPVIGMELIRGLEANTDGTWSGGTILDPETGKIYKASLTLVNDSTLRVRGYIGFSFIGRNQIWKRK